MRFEFTSFMLLSLLVMGAAPSSLWGDDFFERKIRPLLLTHCLECHSASTKIKGGLNLDHRVAWEKGGDSGPVVNFEDPEASLLLKAVSYHDRDLKMPPKQKLSGTEIANLREWIAQGAPDPRESKMVESQKSPPREGRLLWSFEPLKTGSLPQVKHPTWPKDPVDVHILKSLEDQKLIPVKDASAQTLLRRVYFDLTGLPPSAEDLSSFRVEQLDQAVDRLLATPAFAERWAQHWLDMVRFAESSGGGRTLPFKDAWRYRDYVIESLQRDVPLDEFISEQIAGDLMPYHSMEDRRRKLTATTFLALGATNYEEQDKSQLRMDIVDEQLDTLGRSFMGLTLSCARCHDHKFDPVSIQDYYALAGILKNTHTLKNYTDNVAKWVEVPLPEGGPTERWLAEKEGKIAAFTQEIQQVDRQLKKHAPKAKWQAETGVLTKKDFPGLIFDDAEAKREGEWMASANQLPFIEAGYHHDRNLNKGSNRWIYEIQVPSAGAYEMRFAYSHATGRATQVPIEIQHEKGVSKVFVNQRELPPLYGRFVSLGKFEFKPNHNYRVIISNEGTKGHVTVDALWFLDAKAIALENSNSESLEIYRSATERKTELAAQLKQVQSTGPWRSEVMSVREEVEPQDCEIHIRGSIRNLGEKVPRGFVQAIKMEFVPKIPQESSGRLQLAQWVTHAQQPLTPRVLVNRVWMHLFGEGLVRSVDNFGVTGDLPSHPALLDQLASDFVRDGWSLKKLVRRLVLTRTYQLASVPEANEDWAMAEAVDPDNQFRWRGDRRRLDAHAIRDAVLTLGGNLDRSFLGPTVEALRADANSAAAQDLEYHYQFNDQRRSVYSPAFRNKRLQFFEAFDFADINTPISQRPKSTTATQALYLWNHDFIREQSVSFAEDLLKLTALSGDEARVDWLWKQVLGREPSRQEKARALDFLASSESSEFSVKSQDFADLAHALMASADFRFID